MPRKPHFLLDARRGATPLSSRPRRRPKEAGRVGGHMMRVRDGSPKGGDAFFRGSVLRTTARPRLFARERP
jgi:hypothetical protein